MLLLTSQSTKLDMRVDMRDRENSNFKSCLSRFSQDSWTENLELKAGQFRRSADQAWILLPFDQSQIHTWKPQLKFNWT